MFLCHVKVASTFRYMLHRWDFNRILTIAVASTHGMPVFIEKKHTSSLFSANNNIAVWIIGYRAEIFAEQVGVRGFVVCFMFPLNPLYVPRLD